MTVERRTRERREQPLMVGHCVFPMATRAARFTSESEAPAPRLKCPTRDSQLIYRRTILGGVRPPERWDYLDCAACGAFVYRHRTQHLRLVSM